MADFLPLKKKVGDDSLQEFSISAGDKIPAALLPDDSTFKDATPRRAVLYGDSITNQHQTVSGITNQYNSIGYFDWYRASTNQRIDLPFENIIGTGGGNSSGLDTNYATNTAGLTFDTAFVLVGANDLPTLTVAADVTAVIANITSIVNKFVADGAVVFIIEILPRNDNGTPLTAFQKQAHLDINSALMALEDGSTIYGVPMREALTLSASDEPDPQYFKDESGEYLHPNNLGAYTISSELRKVVDPVYGVNASPIGKGLPNILDGTAGTKTNGSLTGDVADLWTFRNNNVGLAGSTFVASKTPEGYQQLDCTYVTGAGALSFYSVEYDLTSGFTEGVDYTAGDTLMVWMNLKINNVVNTKFWLQILDNAGTSAQYIDLGKDSDFFTSLNELGEGTLAFKFQTQPDSTSVSLKFDTDMDSTVTDAILNVVVQDVGLADLTQAPNLDVVASEFGTTTIENLGDLGDVNSAGTEGQVLTKQADGSHAFQDGFSIPLLDATPDPLTGAPLVRITGNGTELAGLYWNTGTLYIQGA